MGTIIVGQKHPKVVSTDDYTIAHANGAKTEKNPSNVAVAQPQPTENKNGMTAEEKAKQIKEIMQLPQEQIVPELRKRGFNETADITEVEMKAKDEQAKAVARENRLKEILALPVDEQLPLLLEEGYDEEAKELSEKLALDGDGEKTDGGNGEENQGKEESTGDDLAELSEGESTEKTEKATKAKSSPKATTKKSK